MKANFLTACAFGIALAGASLSPALAQDATAPSTMTPTAPTDSTNGTSPSSSGLDKPDGPVADGDVFGFDITMGTDQLTDVQREAAVNTCKQKVTIEPQRYSSEVKAFCQQVQ